MLNVDTTIGREPKYDIVAVTAVEHYCRYVTIAVQCVEDAWYIAATRVLYLFLGIIISA